MTFVQNMTQKAYQKATLMSSNLMSTVMWQTSSFLDIIYFCYNDTSFCQFKLLFGFEVLLGLNFSIICKRKFITRPTPKIFLIEEEDIMIISRNNAFSRCDLKNATLNNSKPIRVNKLVTKHLTYQRSLNICKHPSVLSTFSWHAYDFSSCLKWTQNEDDIRFEG